MKNSVLFKQTGLETQSSAQRMQQEIAKSAKKEFET